MDRKSEEINKRLGEASTQLTQLEQSATKTGEKLAWSGPRWPFLNASRGLFKKHLTRFNGQQVIVLACGGQFISRGDQEIMLAAGSLNIALHDAQWDVINFGRPAELDTTCGTIGEGISIFVSPNAPQQTREAERFLQATVDTVLSQLRLVIDDGKPEQFTVNRAPLEPSVIKVLVHAHPMMPTGPGINDKALLEQSNRQ